MGRPKGRGKKLGITIPHDLDKDFDELAELTGIKKSSLITNLLVNTQPHLQKSIEYHKLIKNHEMTVEDARTYFFNLLADYQESVTDAMREINNN